MSKKIKLRSFLMILVEIIALVAVIVLFKNNKAQLWLAIFAVGVIVSLFAGRLYCSWICPMNTLFRPISFIYSKLKIKRLKTPKFLDNNVIRVVFLVLFIATMVVTKKLHIKVNLLLYLIPFSILITLIFEEEFWHRHLCPFGTILSVTSRKSLLNLKIDQEGCISCGKCQKVCPVSSIITLENKKRFNVHHECLECGRCVDVCPTSVCKYTK